MAVLLDEDRTTVWAEYMQLSTENISITKQALRAAIDATDAWIDGNASSFNAALPQPARTALSAKQKALLVMMVAAKRFGVV